MAGRDSAVYCPDEKPNFVLEGMEKFQRRAENVAILTDRNLVRSGRAELRNAGVMSASISGWERDRTESQQSSRAAAQAGALSMHVSNRDVLNCSVAFLRGDGCSGRRRASGMDDRWG